MKDILNENDMLQEKSEEKVKDDISTYELEERDKDDISMYELEEKVKVASQDIVPYDEASVVIDRVYEDSNFQVETLRISILENGQFIGQYYCF